MLNITYSRPFSCFLLNSALHIMQIYFTIVMKSLCCAARKRIIYLLFIILLIITTKRGLSRNLKSYHISQLYSNNCLHKQFYFFNKLKIASHLYQVQIASLTEKIIGEKNYLVAIFYEKGIINRICPKYTC
jgi:hypothetical protein